MRRSDYLLAILLLILILPTLIAVASGSDHQPARPLIGSVPQTDTAEHTRADRNNSLLLEELTTLREETDRQLASLAAEITLASGEQRAGLSRRATAVKREFYIGTLRIQARYAREAGFEEQALELERSAENMAAGYAKGTPQPRSAPIAPRR